MNENTLSFSVSESVGTGDVFGNPGNRGSRPVPLPLTDDEMKRLLGRMIPPHKTLSREVTKEDLPRVIKDAKDMLELCYIPMGPYSGGKALAHPQIDDKDPLAFFVLNSGMIIINPKVVNHTEAPVDKEEGCLTYPMNPMKIVKRYNKVTVQFQTIFTDEHGGYGMTAIREDNLNGPIAHIFQHEVSHLLGHYCFDEDHKPEYCLS